MKKLLVILGCAIFILSACGKDENDADKTARVADQADDIQMKINDIKPEEGRDFMEQVVNNPSLFGREFRKFTPVQQYYFCAAFAMGAMSATKPITASAMVNYFMGLGVAKYNEGINKDTYKAFNLGKNTFRFESVVNAILKHKTCEVIMNDAAEFAKKKNYHVADLDKLGKREVERVIQYIKKK